MDNRRLPFWGIEYAALLVLMAFALIAVFAPWLMPYAPDQIDMRHVLDVPGRA